MSDDVESAMGEIALPQPNRLRIVARFIDWLDRLYNRHDIVIGNLYRFDRRNDLMVMEELAERRRQDDETFRQNMLRRANQ